VCVIGSGTARRVGYSVDKHAGMRRVLCPRLCVRIHEPVLARSTLIHCHSACPDVPARVLVCYSTRGLPGAALVARCSAVQSVPALTCHVDSPIIGPFLRPRGTRWACVCLFICSMCLCSYLLPYCCRLARGHF